MRRKNFIQESILESILSRNALNCITALLERGYHHRVVFKVARRFLRENFHLYGDINRSALWDAVSVVFSAGMGAENAPRPL
jgi:hypothetical protein